MAYSISLALPLGCLAAALVHRLDWHYRLQKVGLIDAVKAESVSAYNDTARMFPSQLSLVGFLRAPRLPSLRGYICVGLEKRRCLLTLRQFEV